MMSDTLEKLGFVPAVEAKLSMTRSPYTVDRGTFYHGNFAGVDNTIAIDESGDLWVLDGHIDLIRHGFHVYGGEMVQ